MIDEKKVIDFLQDFECAKLEHLQILFDSPNFNFKNILRNNVVSLKNNVFIHNRRRLNEDMLVALDILCKYKKNKNLKRFFLGRNIVTINFLAKDNTYYSIIVATKENQKGIVKQISNYSPPLPKSDKIILAVPNREEIDNLDCTIPILCCIYPSLEIINIERSEKKSSL